MLQAMKADLEGRFRQYTEKGLMCLEAAYAGNPEEALEWKEELAKAVPRYACAYGPSVFKRSLPYWTGRSLR